MTEEVSTFFPFEPSLAWSDVVPRARARWDIVDGAASSALECRCVAVPSLRVGLCWTLEFLGFSRHRDHLLIPKFVGRCILNALSRYALPVEVQTQHTRGVVVVDQFGLKQNMSAIAAECAGRGYICIEDSPYGLGENESVSPGTLARFIGLTKVLPIVQGALLMTKDERLAEFVRHKRAQRSLWSLPVWGIMALLRSRKTVRSFSAVAEAAYAMYLESKGGNLWLRTNVLQVLKRLDYFVTQSAQRLNFVRTHLEGNVLIPDLRKLGYVIPFLPGEQVEQARSIFRQEGFDSSLYHVEMNRNLFEPQYVKALLIPVNPRIPWKRFERLVTGLQSLTMGESQILGTKAIPKLACIASYRRPTQYPFSFFRPFSFK